MKRDEILHTASERLINEYKEDSFVDICGYAALAGEMSSADVKRPDWG